MTNEKAYEHAAQLMPGGVSSPVRAFRSVDGTPRIIRRAEGAHLFDVENKRYTDLQMAFGPLLLGHAHPAVVTAIAGAAADGLAFGATSEREIALAEETVRRHPGLAWVRFVNSGTEAVMSAARLARAATGRTLIVKFDGGYHGHADGFLSKAGSGLATFGISSSAGVPPATVADTATLPLDDEGALESFFQAHGDKVAAAFVEGVPANNGLLPQREGWHRKLRKLTREHGALLVVDEVITGFRVGWGGATERFALEPDIVTLGKVLGGGMPVGAYGGRKDLMGLVAPLGPMYQAGTLSGNPVTMSAGLATLQTLAQESEVHSTLARSTLAFARHLDDLAKSAGVPLSTRTQDSILWLVMEDDFRPRDATPMKTESVDRFARLHSALLKEGVYLPPSAYEVCFLSTAHTPDVLDETAQAFGRAFRRLGT